MLIDFAKYIAVYTSSMVKFIAGPLLGAGSGLALWETVLFTILGMMTSVFLFSTIAGKKVRELVLKIFYKNRKLFSPKTRRTVKIWRSYGLTGVAFLTPVLFSPIGGTLIASSFGESKKRIFVYMLASSIFWGTLFSTILHTFNIDKIF